MNNTTHKTTGTTDCRTCRTELPNLLLDTGSQSEPAAAALRAHLAACADCHAELESLQATLRLMDEWTAPEVSPYFDTQLHARLREVQAEGPEGLWERARAYLQFSTGRHLRTLAVGSLGVALAVGGFAGVYEHQVTVNTAASPTVNDLRILDNNAAAIQQMDQLLDGGSQTGSESAPPTT